MKFIHRIIILLAVTCIAFTSCKKDKKDVTYTFSSYKGYADKIVADAPPYTIPVRYTDRILYVKTSSGKEIEITLNADETITFTGNVNVSSDGTIFSGKKTPREIVQIWLRPFGNDQVNFQYQRQEISTGKISGYQFFGIKQP